MNNNRGSNRRRGRGNNRQQGGNQGNRIDSRARGNAPQLLEKYKKLAHDASLNGDRVQAEYYLQFADHYFRVIADSRAVRDEPRARPQGDREQSYDEEYREDEDQYQRAPRENGRDGGGEGRREQANEGRRDREETESDDRDAAEDRGEFEPAENPFIRDNRARRPDGERQSRPRRGAVNGRALAKEEPVAEGPKEDEGPRFDPSSLPPALSAAEEEAPKPRRTRARKPRVTKDASGGEELEIAS